jgi:hypothetical protein
MHRAPTTLQVLAAVAVSPEAVSCRTRELVFEVSYLEDVDDAKPVDPHLFHSVVLNIVINIYSNHTAHIATCLCPTLTCEGHLPLARILVLSQLFLAVRYI